jgi:glycosyltransferase involved in cell wall biosynthesis
VTAPLFSVILTTYDRPELLRQALTSVLEQTVEDLECIVVDDAGTESVQLPDDARVRLVRRDENGGPGAARNTGLDAACGDYVAFLDDDEWFTPQRLQYAVDGLADADVALCWRRSFDEPPEPGRVLSGNVDATVLGGEIPHLGVTSLARTEVPRFDESLRACEDIEWWIRAAPGRTVATVPEYGCVYGHRSETYERSIARPRAEARLEIFRMHDAYFAAHRGAAAFQWLKAGLYARQAGDDALARRALARSARLRPSPKALGHLYRAVTSPVGG